MSQYYAIATLLNHLNIDALLGRRKHREWTVLLENQELKLTSFKATHSAYPKNIKIAGGCPSINLTVFPKDQLPN